AAASTLEDVHKSRRGNRMKSLTLGALALGLLCSAASVAGAETSVKVGLDVDAATLDPRVYRNSTDTRVHSLLYSGLVRLDKDFQPQPDLALSWEWTDPTTAVFQLRKDAKFHDGTPITAEDVAFTYTTALKPDSG